jgi:hypothetical protein
MKLQAPNSQLPTPHSKVQITFEYLGQIRTLNKHPDVQAAVKAGTMSEADARTYPWFLRVSHRIFRLLKRARRQARLHPARTGH